VEGAAVRPPERFHWLATPAVLRALESSARGLHLRPSARGFTLEDAAGTAVARVLVPAVLRLRPGETADELCARAGSPLGRELVVLLRAGAAALGLWCDGALRAHKTFHRYVVRGHGRAQTTYLRRRGKSRYGSRLRLQNARRLLSEVNERANAWWEEERGFDAVYASVPERTWPDLLRAEPPPTFAGRLDPVRIPLHVHEPSFAELQRVRYHLEHGVVEWRRDPLVGGAGPAE
jgi:hypothetical protein